MRNLKMPHNIDKNVNNRQPYREKYPNERFVLSIVKQYENQGLSLSKLIEIGNRGLKKAEIKTQRLKSEEKKLPQIVWFIRQEIMNEIRKIKSS